jgi:putative addiction module CopG family antidote
MRSTQQFSVTLSNELAEMVRGKVQSGEYASESEVIREGLRALQRQQRALEDWLREEVAATYDAMKADPSRARTISQVRARLASARNSVKRAS